MNNHEASAKQTTLAFIARMMIATDNEIQNARANGCALTEELARVCFGEFLDTYAALCGIENDVETL